MNFWFNQNTKKYFLELLASIVSSLQASRCFDMVKTSPQSRDEDGNIVSSDPADLRRYVYNTALIPSGRFEEMLRLMTKDSDQALIVYHQLIQGISTSLVDTTIYILRWSFDFMSVHGFGATIIR